MPSAITTRRNEQHDDHHRYFIVSAYGTFLSYAAPTLVLKHRGQEIRVSRPAIIVHLL